MQKELKPLSDHPRAAVKAEDGTTYIACEPLPFTPGYDKLVPGLRCLVVCTQRSEFGGVHNSVRCKIKECYKHVILVGVGKYYRNVYLVSPMYIAKLKRDGTVPDSFYHQLVLGSLSSEGIMPKKLQSYIRKENVMGRGDRRTGKKKKLKRRRTPDERKAKAKKISSKKSTGKSKKKRITIKSAIFAYFDKVGMKKVTYDRTLKVAQQVKPETAFNHSHFGWYRGKYREERGIE